MAKRTKGLEERVDHQGECSRRNCLLIHGVEENSNGDADKLELNVINDDLEIGLTKVAIDRTHRIGDTKKKRKTAGPIIVKYGRYHDRKLVSLRRNI